MRQKFAKIRDNYNELRIDTEDGLAVVFRAYNEGVAYRLEASDDLRVWELVRAVVLGTSPTVIQEPGPPAHAGRVYRLARP